MTELAERYWENLHATDRLKLLREYKFWEGLSTYHYQFIPEDLKRIIIRNIESNELNDPKISMF